MKCINVGFLLMAIITSLAQNFSALLSCTSAKPNLPIFTDILSRLHLDLSILYAESALGFLF